MRAEPRLAGAEHGKQACPSAITREALTRAHKSWRDSAERRHGTHGSQNGPHAKCFQTSYIFCRGRRHPSAISSYSATVCGNHVIALLIDATARCCNVQVSGGWVETSFNDMSERSSLAHKDVAEAGAVEGRHGAAIHAEVRTGVVIGTKSRIAH